MTPAPPKPHLLICNCNQTMSLDGPSLSKALGAEALPIHTALCRKQAPLFQQGIKSNANVVVACTQERALFSELAEQTEGAQAGVVAPIRFVNIRETGGWSSDARSTPKAINAKIAALIAQATMPDPDPVAQVSYKSDGHVLVIGSLGDALAACQLLGDAVQPSVLLAASLGGHAAHAAPAAPRDLPVLSGKLQALSGYLGAFDLTLERSNPIDLDLCTRCNACIRACPEAAIGEDWQIDLSRCKSHRACVVVCGDAMAIDFDRAPISHSQRFDVVLDLRPEPAFLQHAKPQGYFHAPLSATQRQVDAKTALAITQLVGEFQKPKFFAYKQKLCAHSRNDKTGCTACIDICSARAISSDKSRQQIKVNPNLCVGCGACTTVCPSGALAFQYPKAADTGQRIKTLLKAYQQAGGTDAHLLLHSEGAGSGLVEAWGLAAMRSTAKSAEAIQGPPTHVLPIPLWHTASVGLELWLCAVAFGASRLTVLVTDEEAPQYVEALRSQMAIAQSLLEGLGYALAGAPVPCFDLLQVSDAESKMIATKRMDSRAIWQKHAKDAWNAPPTATFALATDKRDNLERVLEHLTAQAPLARTPNAPQALPLPSGAPLGAITINKDACTMCLSCINACPASALSDNAASGANLPQLNFTEKNCVQCGLCAKTCPENAISLVPQWSMRPERKQAVVVNEMQPYRCIRCQKPFGTLKAIEAMLGKLSGHAMFQGAAADRLKMCMDCRVVDLYSADNEAKITGAAQ